jgi:hypothetical protein
MMNDPIVQEIRQARERLLTEAHGDLKVFMESLRQRELQHPHRVVTPEEFRRRHKKFDESPAPR